MTPISASRLSLLNQCSFKYWCRYGPDKLPDTTNEGACRGSVCHTVFEVLGNPRHKKEYEKIIKAQSISGSPSVKRLVLSSAKRQKERVDDIENLKLINQMILEGLNYDFFGDEHHEPSHVISEKEFDLECKKKKYRIFGFIDKLLVFKEKEKVLIRDFKTSKEIYGEKEIAENIQHLMYLLAVRRLYPEFLKRRMEFVFVKFPCEGGKEGVVKMDEVTEDTLDDFERFLVKQQKVIDNFDENDARKNFAADKGWLSRDEGFGGLAACGYAKFPGHKNKDEKEYYKCSYKFPFKYYKVFTKSGEQKRSIFLDDKDAIKKEKSAGNKLVKSSFSGCPRFQHLTKTKNENTNDWTL